jgi:hypothetical protein
MREQVIRRWLEEDADELVPGQPDLWPRIEAALAPRPRRAPTSALGLAAALVVALGVGSAGLVAQPSLGAGPAPTGAPTPGPAAMSGFEPAPRAVAASVTGTTTTTATPLASLTPWPAG